MKEQPRITRGAVLSVVVSGAIAATALGGAPTANATCASFFGIGNSAQCYSNATTIAIAIGTNAIANASIGLFGTAFAVGTNADATVNGGVLGFATAFGDDSDATANGVLAFALQVSNGGQAIAGGPSQVANIAINIGNGPSYVQAGGGNGNIAVNLGGNASGPITHSVKAIGNFSNAVNLGGTDNKVTAGTIGSVFNTAASIFGSANTVTAGPGPVTLAWSVLQSGKTIIKVGPGININGFTVGGAAAVRSSKKSANVTATHTRQQKSAGTTGSNGRTSSTR